MSSDNIRELEKAPMQTFLLIFNSGIEPEIRDLIRKQKTEWELGPATPGETFWKVPEQDRALTNKLT